MSPDTNVSARPPSSRLSRFAANATWGGLSVVANLAAGVLMAPYLIRKLGADGYGIWSLVFSVANYSTVLDFGFRSAVINFTAREAARQNYGKINEVLNTALAYSAGASVFVLLAIGAIAPRSSTWLGIEPQFQNSFPLLFGIVCGSVGASLCFSIVSGCLEGLQQYGPLRRIHTAILTLRTGAYFLVLWKGGGLIALSLCTLGSFAVLYSAHAILLRRALPQVRISWTLVRSSSFWEMARYGLHTTTNGIATILVDQTPPVIIARSLPDAAVGFFSLPIRIVQIPLAMVRTVTEMLSPVAAEFRAREEHDSLARVGILGNRYCFVLYAPFALLMLTWGTGIVRLWVGDEFAANSAPLLLFFVLGSWIAQAGQGASAGILFGIGAHHWCAWSLMAESVVVAAASVLFVETGLYAVAVWVFAAMIVNRCLFLAWAICRNLHFSFPSYLWSIYGIPSLLALPVWFLLERLDAWTPQKNWWMIGVATLTSAVTYLVPAFFLCIEEPHRRAAIYWIQKAAGRVRKAGG